MCRTVFLRPTELEAQAAQSQIKSSLPPYTPYIPPHAFANLRNPVPPPPLEPEEDKNAFKLPPGLEIVEPSSPLSDDLDIDLKADFDIKVSDEAAADLEEAVVEDFGLQTYASRDFNGAQMSPPSYEANEFSFPSNSYVCSGFSASPPSFDEAEQEICLPPQFSDLDSNSDGSSPVAQIMSLSDSPRRCSLDGSVGLSIGPVEQKPLPQFLDAHAVVVKYDESESVEAVIMNESESGMTRLSSSETVNASAGKQKKGAGPRVEKWKRRDNEKHLAGERKRRANRMGKLGELKELLPNTKQKLSSIKILVAAISHFKQILDKDKKMGSAPILKVEQDVKPVTQETKPLVLDHLSFVQGMRDSNFLSLIEMDSNHLVVHCSPAMKAFLGVEDQAGIGFHISTIIHPADYADQFTSIGFGANSTRTLQLRFGCYLHNGHRVFVPSSVTASSDESKCIFCINPLSTVYDHSGQPPLLVHK